MLGLRIKDLTAKQTLEGGEQCFKEFIEILTNSQLLKLLYESQNEYYNINDHKCKYKQK